MRGGSWARSGCLGRVTARRGFGCFVCRAEPWARRGACADVAGIALTGVIGQVSRASPPQAYSRARDGKGALRSRLAPSAGPIAEGCYC